MIEYLYGAFFTAMVFMGAYARDGKSPRLETYPYIVMAVILWPVYLPMFFGYYLIDKPSRKKRKSK